MEISENVSYGPEIKHVGSYDVLVNKGQTSISSEELTDLYETISKELAMSTPGKTLPLWHENCVQKRIYVDNKDNPRYLAKMKWLKWDNEHFIDALKIKRDFASEVGLYEKKSWYAGMSIANELSLSTDIKEIVNSDSVQEIYRDLGFESIDFIEPLIGIINKETRVKTIVYKYVEGQDLVNYSGEKDVDYRKRMFEAERKLSRIFLEHGIEPDDISACQFIVSKDADNKERIHLIDSEFYFRNNID